MWCRHRATVIGINLTEQVPLSTAGDVILLGERLPWNYDSKTCLGEYVTPFSDASTRRCFEIVSDLPRRERFVRVVEPLKDPLVDTSTHNRGSSIPTFLPTLTRQAPAITCSVGGI